MVKENKVQNKESREILNRYVNRFSKSKDEDKAKLANAIYDIESELALLTEQHDKTILKVMRIIDYINREISVKDNMRVMLDDSTLYAIREIIRDKFEEEIKYLKTKNEK